MSNSVTASGQVVARSQESSLAMAALAMFLGCFLVWGVGFAGASVIHDAAHDARHSFAFPCH